MKEFIDNYGLYICIGLGVLVVIVAIILIVTSKKKKPTEEVNSSILDVNVEGVVESDFKYGYEKEDTVIVKPEDLEQKEEPPVEESTEETPEENNTEEEEKEEN